MAVIPGYDPASILKENQEVLDRGGSRHMDWGGLYLSIPKAHLRVLEMRYPDLASHDGDIKLHAWERFLRSDESKPYRVAKPKYFHGAEVKKAG
jgi:hypothetical protein